MATADRFNVFLQNISLTATQREDARTKYEGVCKKLHDYFYTTDYDGSTKMLSGSYAKGTNVRPARDVDVYFKIPWTEYKESSTAYNVQSNLLQRVRAVLSEKYPGTHIRGDNQVVVVNFSNDHFVEVVPCFEFSSGVFAGQYYVPNTTNGGSWKLADPRSEIKNITSSDTAHGGNTRKLIRMLKKWQENCQVPIRSLVIELRAITFLRSYDYAAHSASYYDWMIRDYFAKLLEYVDGHCKMPGLDERINYGSEWKTKAEMAYLRAVKACRFEEKSEEYNAALEWRKIFGNDYYL